MSSKVENLEGMKFGKLTVLERAKNRNDGIYYLCECDCENKTQKEIRAYALIYNHTKSCGCIVKEKNRRPQSQLFQDLTGKSFYRWKVLKRVENTKYGNTKWLCECQCENKTIKEVLGSYLISGRSRSCGCIRKISTALHNKVNYKKQNAYDLSGEYGIGYTLKGEEFYFDLEDYDKIKDYCWRLGANGYVETSINKYKNNKKYTITLKLHNLVLESPDNMVVDHIAHNVVDNRKKFLRIVTIRENVTNRSMSKNNTSGVTGVTWHKNANAWYARIGYKGKLINLGFFNNFDDAVRARKEAEEKYFGEYSYDNSMKITEETMTQ